MYEDPWRAGGHNGLSNSEDPATPEQPYPRVRQLRDTMRELGLDETAIIMAGGVWHLREWQDWLDNQELGPVGFQFGTRPLLTRESPISDAWKRRLLELEDGDVLLHRFSPTGFYSSAVRNDFLRELEGRSNRQIAFAAAPDAERGLTEPLAFGTRGRWLYVRPEDMERVRVWIAEGYSQAMKTPDDTLIYVARTRRSRSDAIRPTAWAACPPASSATGPAARTTPRASRRIRAPSAFKRLCTRSPTAPRSARQLMFSGHNVYKFRQDPFYSNGFVPTVRQLVERIATGD